MSQSKKSKSAGSTSFIVRVGGSCNNRCVFCSFAPSPPVTLDEVYRSVESSPQRFVTIDGPGEPLVRRDFVRLIHTVRRAGALKVAIATNGRMLAYSAIAAALAELRPDLVMISLHHGTPSGHDAITRVAGSFAQTIKGINNFERLRQRSVTRLMLRFVPSGNDRIRMESLAALALRENLDGIVVDPPGGKCLPSVMREAIFRFHCSGLRILKRQELEKSLQADFKERYSELGVVPPRFHAAERTLSLVIRTGCRNACNFCTTRIIQEGNAAVWPLDRLERFHGAILAMRRRGAVRMRMVAIEPLEHPDIVRLVSFAARAGFENIEAWTSARALADQHFASRLGAAGLTEIDVPILGSRPEIHDAIACSRGAFEETCRGLENARRFGLRCRVHFVLTKQNLDDLGGMMALTKKLDVYPPVSALIPSPSSEDLVIYGEFMPSYTRVMEALGTLSRLDREVLLFRGLVREIPPCIAAGRRERRFLSPGTLVQRSAMREGELSQPGARLKLRVKCSLVRGCILGAVCPGIHTMYERLYGTGEFRPIRNLGVPFADRSLDKRGLRS